ncbi:hypothetical protein FJZ39_01015 [Candidatus Saccharibacteria bacterium]|nr:hypothetical protein [Candidatus Saccharibacteria bacterium]
MAPSEGQLQTEAMIALRQAMTGLTKEISNEAITAKTQVHLMNVTRPHNHTFYYPLEASSSSDRNVEINHTKLQQYASQLFQRCVDETVRRHGVRPNGWVKVAKAVRVGGLLRIDLRSEVTHKFVR